MDLMQQFATIVADKVAHQLKHSLNPKSLAGHKLDMHCRVGRCKQRSRGPRFRYMCELHGNRLTKRQQLAAIATYNTRKAS